MFATLESENALILFDGLYFYPKSFSCIYEFDRRNHLKGPKLS